MVPRVGGPIPRASLQSVIVLDEYPDIRLFRHLSGVATPDICRVPGYPGTHPPISAATTSSSVSTTWAAAGPSGMKESLAVTRAIEPP